MNDLMSKLALSKKIMDKHNEIPRSGNNTLVNNPTPQVESFNPVPATYNLPDEFLTENKTVQTYDNNPPTQDRILNSKLPDEIKKLMLENPIEKPSVPGLNTSFLSNDIIEGAQKLMGTTPKKQVQEQNMSQSPSNIDVNMLKTMIRDTVRDAVRDIVKEELSKSGMIVENESKANDFLQLKVGKHIFEGKVTKIKKVQ
jgi:hypothetical protein